MQTNLADVIGDIDILDKALHVQCFWNQPKKLDESHDQIECLVLSMLDQIEENPDEIYDIDSLFIILFEDLLQLRNLIPFNDGYDVRNAEFLEKRLIAVALFVRNYPF